MQQTLKPSLVLEARCRFSIRNYPIIFFCYKNYRLYVADSLLVPQQQLASSDL